jgi:hypothetical protein
VLFLYTFDLWTYIYMPGLIERVYEKGGSEGETMRAMEDAAKCILL